MAQVIFWSALPNNFFLVQRYLGPYQLSGWLEKNNITAQVIDFTVSSQNKSIPSNLLVKETEKFITEKTVAIGISTTFFNSAVGNKIPENLIDSLRLIRKKYPQIKFLLGGNKAENYSAEITNEFDAVIVGLAEDILVELIDFYKTGDKEPKFRRPIMHKTKFYYNDDVADKKFDIQTSRHVWRDCDLIMPGEVLPLELSRGCIFKCKFCQYPLLGRSKYDYTRNMECVKEELINNYQRWGTTNYYVLDDTMNDTVQKITEFHAMTQQLPFKIQYATYLRADLLHRFPETIPLLKESGLIGAHFGIETFHTEASKIIGKAWSGKQAKDFLPKLIHEEWNDEVAIHCSMIVGLPGEPIEHLFESRDWLIDNNIPSWNFKPLSIARHDQYIFSSEFSREAESYGYVHPMPNNPSYWENVKDGWNRTLAEKVAKKLNQGKAIPDLGTSYGRVTYDSWSIISLLSLGYDLKDLLVKPRGLINKVELHRRWNIWINSYHRRLLNWPNTTEADWKPEFDTIFNSPENAWLTRGTEVFDNIV